jgi:hypothetical protein
MNTNRTIKGEANMAEKTANVTGTQDTTSKPQMKVFAIKAKTPISGYIDGIRIRKGAGETTNAALAAELKAKGYEVTEK